jgi:hypothetical protein
MGHDATSDECVVCNSNIINSTFFYGVDLLQTCMLADYCVPQNQGLTMAAVGWGRQPWLAGACISPSFH